MIINLHFLFKVIQWLHFLPLYFQFVIAWPWNCKWIIQNKMNGLLMNACLWTGPWIPQTFIHSFLYSFGLEHLNFIYLCIHSSIHHKQWIHYPSIIPIYYFHHQWIYEFNLILRLSIYLEDGNVTFGRHNSFQGLFTPLFGKAYFRCIIVENYYWMLS